MRKGKVYYKDLFAGTIEEDIGYTFVYDKEYIKSENAKPISLTMPLRDEPFKSSFMFAFFDGLIPEGWLLDIAEKNWKINSRDRMGLLLAFCNDCIGAVSIIPEES